MRIIFNDIFCRQGKVVNLELKTAIEGAVIKWAQQINDVLNETSDVFFSGNRHPGPLVEVIRLYLHHITPPERYGLQFCKPKFSLIIDCVYINYIHGLKKNLHSALYEKLKPR